MNVLDAIRENIRLYDLRKQDRKVVEERVDKENSLPSDNAVFPWMIKTLKNKNVITAEKAAEYIKLREASELHWENFVSSMLEEIGNKNVRMFYWYKPIGGLCSNRKLPYCISELGKVEFFGSYSKYFESIETKSYKVVVITDYKALLQAVKAGFEGKIAKRDAEAKAFRKKHEEDIAFYEQFRQARNITHEVEAKEYNNKYPNLLCSAAISSADDELAKLD